MSTSVYRDINKGMEIFSYGFKYAFSRSFRANEDEKHRLIVERLEKSEKKADEAINRLAATIDSINSASLSREKRLLKILENNPSIHKQVDAMIFIGINKLDAINICYIESKQPEILKRADELINQGVPLDIAVVTAKKEVVGY